MDDEFDFDIEVIDGRKAVFYLMVNNDGTATIRATCPPEFVVKVLEQMTEAIKDGRVGPGEGYVAL